MAEVITEMVLPGTYIEVRAEGLISVGGIITGRIGIAGTASRGPIMTPVSLGSYSQAKEIFGNYDPWIDGASNELTLMRALEQIFNNGATDVLAVRVKGSAPTASNVSLPDVDGDSQINIRVTDLGSWANGITAEVRTVILRERRAFNVSNEAPFGNGRTTLQLPHTNLQRRGGVSGALTAADISVRNRTTGVAYGLDPAPSAGEFSVNAATGLITFGEAQTIGHVPEVTYYRRGTEVVFTLPNGLQEVYTDIANASALQAALVNSSFLAGTIVAAPSNKALRLGTYTFAGGTDGADASTIDYQEGIALFESQDVNFVLAAGQGTAIASVLTGHCEVMENHGRERIAIMGSDLGEEVPEVLGHLSAISDDRLIFVSPGIRAVDAAASAQQRTRVEVTLPGAYAAAAVAGLLASLPVHHSPTNKALSIVGLEREFLRPQLKQLVQGRVLALERKNGFRVVRGITTDTAAFQQITTRRIVDYAKMGIRLGSLPYIGRLNNERVRKALRGTLDGFLTTMVLDEMLVSYELSVTATRADEIAGRCLVTVFLRPTFSIDFIKVTMFLE
ncbi:MAG: phage tail sheath subtilisin-like domain-containing protein [Anaerolineae bacterium]|nr:phage tail sheath subtilisin-like domain-containing protein [Anaerolineae bacterium]MDW8099640.1 phage tail sheath subtilisin-like domain-containing protein [Anaerolineae bacterium]